MVRSPVHPLGSRRFCIRFFFSSAEVLLVFLLPARNRGLCFFVFVFSSADGSLSAFCFLLEIAPPGISAFLYSFFSSAEVLLVFLLFDRNRGP